MPWTEYQDPVSHKERRGLIFSTDFANERSEGVKLEFPEFQRRFGAITVDKGLITKDQLIKALKIQITHNITEVMISRTV